MWVRFDRLHWHRFSGAVKRRYLAGEVRNVPKAVGDKAIADGAAVKIKAPRRNEKPGGDNGA